MRKHLNLLEGFMGDYLQFREGNTKENILAVLANKKKQERSDAELFET